MKTIDINKSLWFDKYHGRMLKKHRKYFSI
jgi:hypothetical protein